MALLIGATMTAPFTARSEVEATPPPLSSATSQFIELRPLVEAPALKLERIDGKMIGLRSLRGKVVLLSFWATWCPPCRRELPLLERLQQILGPRDFEVVAVSVDREGKSAVTAFLERASVTRLHPFLDPNRSVGVTNTENGTSPFVLYGMPISYVIDRQGRPVGYITGEVDWTADEGLAFLRHYIADER
ncbi:TlpA disulfide reductase family protein [Methylocystis bryophila]|nr:TlpA disulfide reductase family protein [Methylocystis bryophila]